MTRSPTPRAPASRRTRCRFSPGGAAGSSASSAGTSATSPASSVRAAATITRGETRMGEPGSDKLFAQLADTDSVDDRARAEHAHAAVEDARVQHQPADPDPGADEPDPDAAPPAGEPHDEYDPTPAG